MKPNDKVICIDDTGWLDPNFPGPSPVKDGIYCVQEVEKFGGVLAISLVGFHEDGFYRACRFRRLQGATATQLQEEAAL